MTRAIRLTLSILLISLLVGCVRGFMGNFFPRSSILPQLLTVSAATDSFPPADHPLRNVPNGTIIDDLAGLTGFWGTTETVSMADPQTGVATVTFEVFRVLELNVNNGTMREHVLRRCVDPEGCTIFGANTEQVFVRDMEIKILASNRFSRRFLPGGEVASSFISDGSIDFNLLLLAGVDINSGVSFESLFTLQGDFLKTLDGALGSTPHDIIASGNEEAMTTLWVRIAP